MRFVRVVIPIVPALLASACGVPTYLRPDTPSQSASASIPGTKAQILDASIKTLMQDGYQITAVDHATGLISTAPQPMKVTPEEADCGRVKGLAASADPLTYPHPRTRVAFNILAEDGRIEVRSKIDYTLDSESLPTNLTCVSRGVLERKMLNEIKTRIKVM